MSIIAHTSHICLSTMFSFISLCSALQLDFIFTDSWSYWKYTDLVDVDLNAGVNSIKLVVSAQDAGPHIDHLRVGKPPAVVLKTNGWPRTVATNGLNLLDEWYPEIVDESVFFPAYADPPQGDLYRYVYGRTKVELPDGRQRYLDVGNVSTSLIFLTFALGY